VRVVAVLAFMVVWLLLFDALVVLVLAVMVVAVVVVMAVVGWVVGMVPWVPATGWWAGAVPWVPVVVLTAVLRWVMVVGLVGIVRFPPWLGVTRAAAGLVAWLERDAGGPCRSVSMFGFMVAGERLAYLMK